MSFARSVGSTDFLCAPEGTSCIGCKQGIVDCLGIYTAIALLHPRHYQNENLIRRSMLDDVYEMFWDDKPRKALFCFQIERNLRGFEPRSLRAPTLG
jgi:hypothetical protein